jgi:hypothetical protein
VPRNAFSGHQRSLHKIQSHPEGKRCTMNQAFNFTGNSMVFALWNSLCRFPVE